LGISNAQAVRYEYPSISYVFCCQGCLKLFKQAPQLYLKETTDIVVCPTCLTEKPIAYTQTIQFDGKALHFCRCPYCLDTINKNPRDYLDRLAGKTDLKGLFGDDEGACCYSI
jgi:YHS domain-containing protein